MDQVTHPNDPASGAQLWRLNSLGLIEKALELSAKVGSYVQNTPLVTKGVASELLAEAKEKGLW